MRVRRGLTFPFESVVDTVKLIFHSLVASGGLVEWQGARARVLHRYVVTYGKCINALALPTRACPEFHLSWNLISCPSPISHHPGAHPILPSLLLSSLFLVLLALLSLVPSLESSQDFPSVTPSSHATLVRHPFNPFSFISSNLPSASSLFRQGRRHPLLIQPYRPSHLFHRTASYTIY